MDLPFTVEQFLDVFAEYNQSVWPFQIVLYLFALTAVFLTIKRFSYGNKIVSGILGFFWIWIGVVYHIVFFSSINSAAYVFGILFIIQGFIFLHAGIYKDNLIFQFKLNTYSIVGLVFLLYALIIYPVLSHNFGHIYPHQPTFGLPCPTTIFTFGILLWTIRPVSKYILIIPFLWSLIGFSAAVNLYVREDFGLVIAGIVGLTLLVIRDKKLKTHKDEISI